MKLLYAEDEKALSMAVAEILKMEGFDVDAVYSGDEAYNSICNGTYDAADPDNLGGCIMLLNKRLE